MKNQLKKWISVMLVMSVLTLLPLNAFAVTSVNGTATQNNGEISISGMVTDAVFEQQITVLVVTGGADVENLSSSEIAYVAQTVPVNGEYSLTFTMPVAKRTGTYDVYVGGTEVGTPDEDSFTFATEAPTAAPAATPAVDMATAKPAVNGANAFYYFITITLNDGTATGFTVKHYPEGVNEENAAVADFGTQNISNAVVKVISVLKGIPDEEINRSITSKATLTYTIGGNSGTAEDIKTTTLNTTRGN